MIGQIVYIILVRAWQVGNHLWLEKIFSTLLGTVSVTSSDLPFKREASPIYSGTLEKDLQ